MKILLTLSLAIAFSLIFFSCKKHHTEGPASNDHYVRYKMNGTLVTNTRLNYAWLKPNAPTNPSQIMFMLVSNSNDLKDVLGFTIQRNGSLPVGTYNSWDDPVHFIVDYFQDNTAPNEKDFTIGNAPGNPASTFTIVLTSITSTEIKGTFTGNYLYDYVGHGTISITEGEFCVKRNP